MPSSLDPVRLGGDLAARHAADSEISVDETLTALAVAESPRVDDWTLRSALVRFAQSQPDLSSAILESVRRTQATLDPHIRELFRHGVMTDRRLALRDDGDLAPPADPCPDVRVGDLARLVRAGVDGEALAAAYDTATTSAGGAPLSPTERAAIPLLVVLLDLDELAETLARWASSTAPADPPVAEANRLGRLAFDRLAALGVARETRERPPGRRSPTSNQG